MRSLGFLCCSSTGMCCFQCTESKTIGMWQLWSLNAEVAHSWEVFVHVCVSVSELVHLVGSMHCQLCTIPSLCPSGTSLSQDQSSWGPHRPPRLFPLSISQHPSLSIIFCPCCLSIFIPHDPSLPDPCTPPHTDTHTCISNIHVHLLWKMIKC